MQPRHWGDSSSIALYELRGKTATKRDLVRCWPSLGCCSVLDVSPSLPPSLALPPPLAAERIDGFRDAVRQVRVTSCGNRVTFPPAQRSSKKNPPRMKTYEGMNRSVDPLIKKPPAPVGSACGLRCSILRDRISIAYSATPRLLCPSLSAKANERLIAREIRESEDRF